MDATDLHRCARERADELPGSGLEHPFGPEWDVYKVRGKVFMLLSVLGGEPIVRRDGGLLVDGRGRRSFVTTAGSGPSVGKHLLMAYLPTEVASVGEPLAVEYVGDRYAVTVAAVGAEPLFDPANSKVYRHPTFFEIPDEVGHM